MPVYEFLLAVVGLAAWPGTWFVVAIFAAIWLAGDRL